MDLLKLIGDNSNALAGSVFETGLGAVVRHLQRAEAFLKSRSLSNEGARILLRELVALRTTTLSAAAR